MSSPRRLVAFLSLGVIGLCALAVGAIAWSMPHRSEATGGPPEMHLAVGVGGSCTGVSPGVVCTVPNGGTFTLKVDGSGTDIGGFLNEVFLGGLNYLPKICSTEVTMNPEFLCGGPTIGVGGQVFHFNDTGLIPPVPVWSNPPNLVAMPNVSCSTPGAYQVVLTATGYTPVGSYLKNTTGSLISIKTRTTATVDPDGPGGNDPITIPVADTLTVLCADPDADTDGDGCKDVQEAGTNPVAGGLRNPLNYWDFADMWTRVSIFGPWEHTKTIDLIDVAATAKRFAKTGNPSDDPMIAPTDEYGYHVSYDRTVTGPQPWDLGPANGAIGLTDIYNVIKQFAHSCA